MDKINLNNKTFDSIKNDLICGRFEFSLLPSIRPRIIRMFLCAPFKDVFDEVNYLHKFVFPKLREFTVSRYGFEFQVVDLFWGLNCENVETLEDIEELCMKELDKCNSDSIGITFLSLIGDLYGLIDLPQSIERHKFDIIIQILRENNQNYSLIEQYYELNINYLSNKYELNQTKKLSIDLRSKLCQLLISGTRLAVEKNLLDKDFLSNLDSSIFEKMVSKGIVNMDSKQNKVFSYVRFLFDMKNSDNEHKLNHLKNKQINYFCPAEQIYRIRINKVDQTYLKNFGQHYLKTFEHLIEKCVQQNPESKYQPPYDDILNHFDYIKSTNMITANNELIMKTFRDYVFDEKTTKPLILIGPNGSGKTTYVSIMASNLYFQFMACDKLTDTNSSNSNYSLVLRFIGIDEKSYYLRNLLRSICLQLSLILNKPIDKVPNKLTDLKYYFKNILVQNQTIKLIVILDSLECLSNKDYSYKLDWLPDYLNYNCKLILTISSDCGELVERIKRKYPDQNDYLNMSYLNLDDTNYVLRKFLTQNNYRLERDQIDLVQNLARKIGSLLPLHLKLILDEILKWKSYSDECVLKSSLVEMITYLIEKLEIKFGDRLVKHMLSYITISKTGLSELELSDILSLDNDLLKDFKSKDMLNHWPNIVRLPYLYVSKIVNYFKAYLITRPFHGVYTIYWRHKIFGEIVFNKYLASNSKFVEYLHRNISEYYLGTWSNSRAKYLSYELTVSSKTLNPECLFDKLITQKYDIEADRLLPTQPIEYTNFHTHIKPRYNLRKLSLLPFHLFKANMSKDYLKELLENVYFNIEWLYLKIKAFDLKQLLYDFDLYENDDETNIICECLKMAESAIAEDPKYLFNELSGRLLPFYDLYPNIKKLVDQCDEMSLKLNPLLPIGQAFNSPSWIFRDNIPIKMKANDTIDIEILESSYNGRILMAKNHQSTMAKFIDLDQLEEMNQANVGEGKCYCSKTGDFFCVVEANCKLRIKRIQTGDFYTHGLVEFGPNEIGRLFMANKYVAITFRKSSSPVLIDLNSCQILQVFPYSTNYCTFSPDDKVIVIHSEKSLNYFILNGPNGIERKFCLSSLEIPELVVFTNKNRRLFSLFKDTKQIIYYNLNLEKNLYNSDYIIQDRDITDMKCTQDETKLIVCSLNCIYVLDISNEDIRVIHKLKANDLDLINMNNLNNKMNFFNGFGSTQDNKIVYGTIYSYLICFDIVTGNVIRLFQSSVSANRILKSCSSRFSDTMLSLLDNGEVILWNLASLKVNTMKFNDMRLHSSQVVNCLLPQQSDNTQLALSYSDTSPDIKIHYLTNKLATKSIIKESYNEQVDDPLKTNVKFCCLNDSGEYCFILTEVQEFKGKQLSEKNFSKRNCSIIDLCNHNKQIGSFSYIVKNDSRFEIDACFIRHPITNVLFLLFKLTSCINDFDPYCQTQLDWSEFETTIKIFGPISSTLDKIDLFDEFKLNGECLSDYCLLNTNNRLFFACLMQECNKLMDKKQPNVCLAKRYEVRLNFYNIFESKANSLPLEHITLNEFLTNEQFYYKNVMLDIRLISGGQLLVTYSKQGAVLNQLCSDPTLISRYDYDYEKSRFIRDICTEKAGIIFDLINNKVVRNFTSVFTSTTNVEAMLVTKCGSFLIDNNWHLYDLTKNNIRLLRKISLLSIDLSLNLVRFVLNGEYLLVSNSDHNKVYLVRCNDSVEVASFRLDNGLSLSCLSVGELDRTVLLGTQTGCVIPFRLLIDLEFNEAICRFKNVYRNVKVKNVKAVLNEDMKKVRHSAHAHLQMKSKEASRLFSSRSDLRTNTSMSERVDNPNTEYIRNDIIHNGIQKTNLVNLTYGIKYSNAKNTTRACIIQ